MSVFLVLIVIGISIYGLYRAYTLAQWVLSRGTGTEPMQRISNAIKEGAEAFLRRQNTTIIVLAIFVAAFLFIGYGYVREAREFDPTSRFGLAFSTTASKRSPPRSKTTRLPIPRIANWRRR